MGDLISNLNIRSVVAYVVGGLIFFLFGLITARKLHRAIHRMLARRAHDLDLAKMRERWLRIQAMVRSPDPNTDRLAVIEADNLLDLVLKAMHMPGETMAFRLKFAQNKFYELKRVRWCHSIRNKLVHEPDFRLQKKQAIAAVKEYERVLKLLGAL